MFDLLLNFNYYKSIGLIVVIASLFLLPYSKSMLIYVKLGSICFIGATLLSYLYP